MPSRSSIRPTLSVWARLAAFFSVLAVLLALVAPVVSMAREVASGQISGICHVSPVSSTDSAPGTDNSLEPGSHCSLCASLGWALPPLAVAGTPCFSGEQVAAADIPATTSAAIPGLPFGRGPPFLLN